MVLRMLDVASGKPLPIEIPGSPRAVQWLPDGSGFIYQRRINPDDPATNAVLFHQVGQESGRDRLLFRQYTVAEEPRWRRPRDHLPVCPGRPVAGCRLLDVH